MAERKDTIMVFGNPVNVSEVPVIRSEERANDYELEDGSTIRFKAVATAVLRLEGQYDGEGNPMYLVKNGQIVTVIKAAANLRKAPA
ncbi:MAG: hypothetical protein ACHQ9S_15280 [Candidatus Binatia bacterium]